MPASVELGLGIIGLGKPWGHVSSEVPAERDALELLEFAFETGIRYFDSAPSYGIAEARLGKFLRSLDSGQRGQLRIATKFGEHWDAARGEPYVDHTAGALCRSLDSSLGYLGRIDVLQLHKTTVEALRSAGLQSAWEYAKQVAVPMIGASVSDLESAELVIGESRYGCIQAPLNRSNDKFSPSIRAAADRGMWIATNRPFAMGAMLYGPQPVTLKDAFRFVMEHEFTGVVLTGTKSKQHLAKNWEAFHSALSQISGDRCC